MTKKTRNLTLSALFAALSVVSLYLASVWPTGQLGFAAFSSLFVAAAVIEMGIVPGIYVFIVSSALSMLITPDRSAPLLYVLFFGYYPIVKTLVDRIRRMMFQWVAKLGVLNAALTAILLFFKELLLSFSVNITGVIVLYLCCNIAFVLFDYGYSKLIRYYISSISRYLKGR